MTNRQLWSLDPDYERHPRNEIENGIEPLETAWADFLYGVRLGTRYIRAETRPSMKGATLLAVHRLLDDYKRQAAEGEPIAVWRALIYCIKENVPLPYWLGDAILEIERKVNRKPASLHELFGLEAKIPAQGKRAETTRRDVNLQQNLWYVAKGLMATEKISADAAIKRAREQLNFPYSQRKSREMFDAQMRIERAHNDALKGVKKHRMR
ncbi:MAG: hypothetical protein WB870_06890 [Gallionellaceae bacterium]